ncbi:MAG: oxidoreductase, partial [Clostridia bacterium]|nr:oxidoreductase [Clostridia bacterium]
VVDGAHTLYAILEAATLGQVEAFMKPFAQAGSVEIWPASPCEKVVARGGCETGQSA